MTKASELREMSDEQLGLTLPPKTARASVSVCRIKAQDQAGFGRPPASYASIAG